MKALVCVKRVIDYNVKIRVKSDKSGEEDNNKINLFMRYRVAIQFVTLVILSIALFVKS